MSGCYDITQVLLSVSGFQTGDILLERFELLSLLGNGAHGSVFLAKDNLLQCQVALKILHADLLSDQALLDTVRNEILLARSVTHPNVVRVHDVYLTGQRIFFSMDYIDGQPLSALTPARLKQQPELAQQLGTQLIDAVNAVHQQGIVHCDIKPDNILVDQHNRLFLTDLGLASVLHSVQHQACTPAYSAPEVLQTGRHSQQSDYYAVAVTLFQLLMQRLPFDKADMRQHLLAKLTQSSPAGQVSLRYPKWRRFFQQNLSPLAAARSQSADEFRQLWLSAARTPGWLLPLFVLLLVSVLALVYAFWPVATAPEQTAGSAPEPLSVAILPTVALQHSKQEATLALLVQRVLYEQLRNRRLKLISPERVDTTLSHLGFTQPLSEQEVTQVAELLGVDLLFSSELTLIDTRVELALTLSDQRQVVNTRIWHDRFNVEVATLSSVLSKQLLTLNQALEAPTPSDELQQLVPDAALQLQQQIILAQTRNDELHLAGLFSQMQQQFPQLALGYRMAADWYLQQNDTLQAEHYYRLAVENSAVGSAGFLAASARLAALQENYVIADQHYKALIERQPFDTPLIVEYSQLLVRQARYPDAIAQLQSLLSSGTPDPDIYLQLGKLAIRTGDINRALDDYLLQAQVWFRRLKHARGLADTLNATGVALQRTGRFIEATEQYQQALLAFSQVEDTAGMAKASANLGFMQFVSGQRAEAVTTLHQAKRYYQQLEDNVGLASVIDNLGMLEEELGHYQQAKQYFTEAFAIRTRLDDSWLVTESLINLGYVFFVQSEYEQSLVYLKQAEHAAVANNDALNLIKVRQVLAQLKLQQGEWAQAYRLLQATSEDAIALGLSEDDLISQAYLARLSAIQGNFVSAETELKRYMQQAGQNVDGRAVIEFSLWLCELYQHSAQYDKAAALIASLQLGQETLSNYEQTQTLQLLQVQQDLLQKNLSQAKAGLANFNQSAGGQTLAKLHLKAFLMRQQLKLLEHQAVEQMPVHLQHLLGFHINEHLSWLELQALHALKQQDLDQVSFYLNQALPLLRRATSYWRNFSFAYLQRYISAAKLKSAVRLADFPEFQRVIKRVPEAYQQSLLARESSILADYDH